MFGRARRKVSIGLDIGQHTVKWAATDAESGRIRELFSTPLMPQRQQRLDVLEGDALEARLREILDTWQKTSACWSKSVNTSVQGAGSICGYLDLPRLSERELKMAVPSKLTKQLPFAVDDVALSFATVPPLVNDLNRTAVVYVAVQKKLIDAHATMLKRLGLELNNVEVPALALAREFNHNHPEAAQHFVALVSFGHLLTHVVLVRNGNPYYQRQFPTAGAEGTYACQVGNQSDWISAEQHKHGLDATARTVALEPFLTRWLGEVKRTIDSFHQRTASAQCRVVRAVLGGAGSSWQGLSRRLSETLQLPTEIDGWHALEIEPAARQAGPPSLFKLAVGLALTR